MQAPAGPQPLPPEEWVRVGRLAVSWRASPRGSVEELIWVQEPAEPQPARKLEQGPTGPQPPSSGKLRQVQGGVGLQLSCELGHKESEGQAQRKQS